MIALVTKPIEVVYETMGGSVLAHVMLVYANDMLFPPCSCVKSS